MQTYNKLVRVKLHYVLFILEHLRKQSLIEKLLCIMTLTCNLGKGHENILVFSNTIHMMFHWKDVNIDQNNLPQIRIKLFTTYQP
jgi:hypothetical protein